MIICVVVCKCAFVNYMCVWCVCLFVCIVCLYVYVRVLCMRSRAQKMNKRMCMCAVLHFHFFMLTVSV